MKSDKLFLGLLAGFSTGAILGILAAPKITSAKNKLFRKKGDFADELKEKFDDLFESMTQKFKSVQKETSEFIAKEKQKIDELKKSVKTANN
jgi:gas vesicle protein